MKSNSDDARLQAALLEAPVGIVLTSPEGRILEANEVYLEMLGYGANELRASDSTPFTHPDDVAPSKAFFTTLVSGSRPVATLEKRYLRKNGQLLWARVSGKLRRDAAGQPLDVIAVIEDISDRKKLEIRDAFLLRLDDATRALAEPLAITRIAARMLGEHLEVTRCAYAVVESDEDSAHVLGDHNRGVESMVGDYKVSSFGAEFLRMMRAGETFIMTDSETDPRAAAVLESYRANGIRSSVCVPLQKHGRLVAGLGVHHATPRLWTSGEVELVALVAGRCWESIERARITRELQERDQRFRFLAEVIPQMVWTATADGMLDYVSTQGVNYFGVPMDRLLGAGWLSMVHPDDTAKTVERWMHSLASGEDYETAFRLLRAHDSSWRLHLVRAVPLKSPAGAVLQWFGTCTDIEDQHRAKQQIEEDRQRWRELLLQTPAAVAILRGPEHRFEWVNSEYVALAGHPAEELLGKGVVEALPEIAGQDYLQLLNHVYRTGEPFHGHEAPLRIDAREVYLNFVYLPTVDASGRIDGIFVHATNVTDLVRGRKRVEESEQQFRTLAETIPHLCWMANDNGDVFWYNRRWFEFTGKTMEQMRGWGWEEVHDPAVLPAVMERWRESIATGEPLEMICPLRGNDGAFRTFLTRVEPVKDSWGRVVRWFGTHTDITEQQRTEVELRRMNRELEEFAYVASHDLQEPLRMVNIYTQLMLRTVDATDGKLAQYSGFVRQGVKRMENLISDLLTFSSSVHAHEQVHGTADLVEALSEASAVLKQRIEETGARVTVDSPLPLVRGDTPQMAHVFQNLLSNALKYRRPGVPVEIGITIECANDCAVVCVRDNGIGFEPQYAERIFGLFKRLHKEEYPGTGLGLAICQRIVERYGGRMWAEGTPGEGAAFYFSLPLAKP